MLIPFALFFSITNSQGKTALEATSKPLISNMLHKYEEELKNDRTMTEDFGESGEANVIKEEEEDEDDSDYETKEREIEKIRKFSSNADLNTPGNSAPLRHRLSSQEPSSYELLKSNSQANSDFLSEKITMPAFLKAELYGRSSEENKKNNLIISSGSGSEIEKMSTESSRKLFLSENDGNCSIPSEEEKKLERTRSGETPSSLLPIHPQTNSPPQNESVVSQDQNIKRRNHSDQHTEVFPNLVLTPSIYEGPYFIPPKPAKVKGYLYRTGGIIFTKNWRFFVLNPVEGHFTRYLKRQHYPHKHRGILSLKKISNCKRINPSWHMNKSFFYFEVKSIYKIK